MHESGRLRNRKKLFSSPKQKPLSKNYQQQFVQDNSDTEDEALANEARDTCSPKLEGDLYNQDEQSDYCVRTGDVSQKLNTNTSVLDQQDDYQ